MLISNRLKCKNIFISTLIDKIYQYLLLINNIYDTLVYGNFKAKAQTDPPAPTREKNPNQQKRPQPVKYNRSAITRPFQ